MYSTKNRVNQFVRASIYKIHGRFPLDVIPGASPPCRVGKSWYFTTIGGKPIRHPSAYRWPKIYHPSEAKITVGQAWIDARVNLRHGYTWGNDRIGLYVTDRSGYRYHPTHLDVFERRCEAKLRESRDAAKRFRATSRSLRGVLVLAADARATGSCWAGIGSAARAAGREGSLGNPYASVRAERLLKIADRRADLRAGIILAAEFAALRETEFSI